MAPYPKDQDLEGGLPTANPSGSSCIFPGSLNMNIDPPNTNPGAGTGIFPPPPKPPPPPPVSTYCTGKRRLNFRTSPAHQKQKEKEQEEQKKKEEIPTHSGEEQQEQQKQQHHYKRSSGTYGFQPEDFEDFRPRPAVIIKEPDLKYEGENFKEFLDRFELAAEIYGAGEFYKARQICRFVIKGEDLKKELESMEGYKDRDWTTLHKSMLDVWEGSPLNI
ncbi:hypothetical protein PCASD_07528 [Puccinia coronata f. sp. avenae]|uniref:Uncharacterized protein n=1 Tax=Puccinia coronata f. sp. avenae TaxID=200324 RepID=A0A2N5V083_9BASI|nr:hypothetical protein PCASD_07528 [Puccinia coronata f. sp. avenae]